MRWFTDLDDLMQYVFVVAFVSVIGIVVTFIICYREQSNELEKAAIEAGLHQEVIDGEVVWTK